MGREVKIPLNLSAAIIQNAQKYGLKVASHIFYSQDAKDLLTAGLDALAHSVRDKPVDEELIDLMKKKGAWQAANFTREASVFAFVKTPPFIDDLPGLQDVDFSAAKLTHIKERVHVQFRAEVFNLMNHPNFGQPNRTTTSADFGRITATRTARGDLGSSRQLQLGLKLTF